MKARAQLEEATTYGFTVGGGVDFGIGRVTVTLDYTRKAQQTDTMVMVYYVNDQGDLTRMPWTNFQDGKVRFETSHWSVYAVTEEEPLFTAFTDVANHWAKESITFMAAHCLLSGVGEEMFSPDTAMTRGMFVTVLGRIAGIDAAQDTGANVFTDVRADAYYKGYLTWASKNNVVSGIGDGKFAPDQPISREQMAVILMNYTQTIGFTTTKVDEENPFADNAKISAYAKEAVQQMQMTGILTGKSGNVFDPQGTATRGEVSALLYRFVERMLSDSTI